MMIYPAIFGLILATTGSYKLGFALASIPALFAFVMFIYKPVQGPWTSTFAAALKRAFSWRRAARTAALMSAGIVIGVVVFRFSG
jgi:hypothetical protein